MEGAACGPGGACPYPLSCFDGLCLREPAEPDPADPAGPDAGPGVVPPCVIGGIDLCMFAAGGPLAISASTMLDTDSDPRCQTLPQPGGPAACLVYASTISIAPGAVLRGVGSRPLVIASADSINVEGVLDVASQRTGRTGAGAGTVTCARGDTPEADPGGGGGGAGGSFGGVGGDGGVGDTNTSHGGDGNGQPGTAGNALPPPTVAKGSCAGTSGGNGMGGALGGAGGAGGGVVWLVANGTINVSGIVTAAGAGGSGGQENAGGGGGGSGGYVRIAATMVNVSGTIAANGGAGGSGGCNCAALTGSRGADGNADASAAPGGSGAGGDGGDSSDSQQVDGASGDQSGYAAGGGGGGAGYIVLAGVVNATGIVSPPAR